MSLFSSYSDSKDIASCIWTAYRCDIIDGPKDTLDSPRFGPKHAPETRFSIRLQRRGDNAGAIMLRLVKCDSEERAINVQCKFQVGNIPEESGRSQLMEGSVCGNCRISDFPGDQLKVLTLKDLKLLFGSSTCIIMHCSVTIRDLNPKFSEPSYHTEHLAGNLSMLLRDPLFSDVTLKTTIDDREFPAHKNILSARSKVFATMFTNEGFLEAKQKELEIPDIPGEVMAVLLDYIYSGDIANVGPMVSELLVAADKYDIQPLIQICVSHMNMTICSESAAKILYMADLYRIEQLKSQAIDFICQHAAEVRETEGWSQYIRPSSDMLEALFSNMAAKKGLHGAAGSGSGGENVSAIDRFNGIVGSKRK